MTQEEILAEEIVKTIIDGWPKHSAHFMSVVDCENYWLKRIQELNPNTAIVERLKVVIDECERFLENTSTKSNLYAEVNDTRMTLTKILTGE